jgi:dinuclear metal center YbgI/SA1388 family protein
MSVALADLCGYLDEYLRLTEVPDYPGAHNGLQVANPGTVRKIAAAVDASQRALEAAVAEGADLLLVHHGLFWDGKLPVTGRRYRRLSLALENDLAVYSAHLPLDVHPEVGNNVALARALGAELGGTFGSYRGQPIGRWGKLEVRREALASRLDELLGGRVRMIAGGPERLRRIGVVTGSGADLVGDAREAGLDALVTGEGAHHTFFDAMEGGVNLYLGGHYATETFGVRMLASHLEARFGLPWTFLDQPTGL